jgi:hypothetical protein
MTAEEMKVEAEAAANRLIATRLRRWTMGEKELGRLSQ